MLDRQEEGHSFRQGTFMLSVFVWVGGCLLYVPVGVGVRAWERVGRVPGVVGSNVCVLPVLCAIKRKRV